MVHAIDTAVSRKLRELDLFGSAEALLMAAPRVERDILEPILGPITSASLFGSYGPGHVTTDIVDLKEFPDARFDFFEASLLFDYVPESDAAFDSVSRVLRGKSVMFFHIGEGRLKPGDMPPRLKRYRTDWTAHYYPDDYQQPIVQFGRDWITGKLQSHGFEVEQIIWNDPGTEKSLTWWLAWRNRD